MLLRPLSRLSPGLLARSHTAESASFSLSLTASVRSCVVVREAGLYAMSTSANSNVLNV